MNTKKSHEAIVGMGIMGYSIIYMKQLINSHLSYYSNNTNVWMNYIINIYNIQYTVNREI